jgi:sarcosine oxidase subunit beta
MSDVVVLERAGIGSQASGSNYGMVWQQTRLPGLDLNFARHSLRMYRELVSEEFDIDIEFEERGGMTVFWTPEQKAVMRLVVQEKQSQGIPVQLLDAEEAREREPALSPEIDGSTYCAEEAQLNPILTTLAFARAAQRVGADIRTATEVRGIRVENGRVTGVLTNRGEIETRLVVNAAGSWGRQIAKMVGIEIPVFPQRLQSLVTEPLTDPLIHRVLQGGREVTEEEVEHPEKVLSFAIELPPGAGEESLPKESLEDSIFPYLKPTCSGNVVIGTTSEFVGHDTGVLPRALHLMIRKAVRIVPALRHAHIIRTWGNFVPFTFDSLPILGRIPEVEGFVLACGHAHALSHAPPTAETLTELIIDGEPSIPIDDASVMRFRG